ncbi:MAG: hypothetical protein IPF55_05685 [Rhodoferax sp.]|nr:hypothetical protein [Rhodoferax sp.]
MTSNRQTSSSQILYAGYNPKGWIGNVRSCAPSQTATQCNTTPAWEASRWFKTTAPTFVATPLTPATRKIFTSWKGASFTTMPFQWASLNASQTGILDSVDLQGSARVDFLRGARTNEGSLFRVRDDLLLGDVVNSGVTYLAGSGPVMAGSNFAGHAAYRAANKTRPGVVYVGANDGMLHAFSGTDGKELFGYIPGSVFGNLPKLTATAFQHRFFVDGTPMVGDIQTGVSTWGTFLVGGLGGGGQGYYALDITNQSGFAAASEATLSAMPKWEFTSAQDADLGYTFNEPSIDPTTGAYLQIAKVTEGVSGSTGQWRVIVGNGFGSTAGQAALFMLDANAGTVATKLVADIGPNNGLAAPTPVDTNGDGLVDTVYAGDALGNMHKFQFSKPSGSNYVRATNGDSAGAWRHLGVLIATGEPITTAPAVSRACDGVGWSVNFGTGKLNEDADYTDTSTRGFYSVIDKNASSALTVLTTNLATLTLTTSTVGSATVRNWTAPDLSASTNRGWKMSFTGGERVLSNSTFPPDTGTVLLATTKPTGDVCSPGNSGFIMAVNVCTGAIGEMLINGTLVGGLAVDSTGVIKVSNTYTDATRKQKIVCNQDACKGEAGPLFVTPVAPKGRYTWRELFSK